MNELQNLYGILKYMYDLRKYCTTKIPKNWKNQIKFPNLWIKYLKLISPIF